MAAMEVRKRGERTGVRGEEAAFSPLPTGERGWG